MIFYFLLFFCAFIPFQFALNPGGDIDLVGGRILALFIFFFWLIESLKNKKVILPPRYFLQIFLSFWLFIILSATQAENLIWSLRKMAFLLSFFPLLFVFSAVQNEEKYHNIISALLSGGYFLASLALFQFSLQFFFGLEKILPIWEKITLFFLGKNFSQTVFQHQSWLVNAGGTNFFRAIAIFPDPHMLAYYLEMLLPFGIASAMLTAEKKIAWKHAFFSLLVFIALLLTFSRGAYVGILSGAVFAFFIFSKKISLPRRKIFFAGTLIISLLFALTDNPLKNRLFSSFNLLESSNSGRLAMWKIAWEIIQEKPFFGVGLGNFSSTALPSAQYRDPLYAHNLYLDIASESGFPATIFFILLVIIAILGYNKKGQKNIFWQAGAISLFIFSIHSIFENPLYSVHILPLLVILLTIGIGKDAAYV